MRHRCFMLFYYIEFNVSLSLRCFLQSRQSLRMLNYKQPPPMQRWKGSSMCWIRGSLYRVSANKLSRTVASSMSINRTGIAVMSYNSDNMHRFYPYHIWFRNDNDWTVISDKNVSVMNTNYANYTKSPKHQFTILCFTIIFLFGLLSLRSHHGSYMSYLTDLNFNWISTTD